MGIAPFLTASALDCVVAQCLARKLCPACKQPVSLTAAALKAAGFSADSDVEAWGPAGCARCNNSGYKGRMGIYEVMTVSDEIRALALKRQSSSALRQVALEQGMRSLREDGLEKVSLGITSIAEITRVA